MGCGKNRARIVRIHTHSQAKDGIPTHSNSLSNKVCTPLVDIIISKHHRQHHHLPCLVFSCLAYTHAIPLSSSPPSRPGPTTTTLGPGGDPRRRSYCVRHLETDGARLEAWAMPSGSAFRHYRMGEASSSSSCPRTFTGRLGEAVSDRCGPKNRREGQTGKHWRGLEGAGPQDHTLTTTVLPS